MMKKLFFITLITIVMGIGSLAHAVDWVGSVYNDTTDTYIPNVYLFDWASSGSGVATGLGGLPGQLPAPGTEFVFVYQARLNALEQINGNPVIFPGLNDEFEYTAVAMIPETFVGSFPAIDLDPGSPTFGQVIGVTAIFRSDPGATWYMWHDGPGNLNDPAAPGPPNSDVLSGFGFDDGDFVASGTINPGQGSNFTLYTVGPDTGTGKGSTVLEGLVDDASSAYLLPASIIFDFRFESTLNFPPGNSLTSLFFDGKAGEGAYQVYAVQPDDFLFKVDGSSTFSVIPEPGTIILLGAGLIALVGVSRKRMKG